MRGGLDAEHSWLSPIEQSRLERLRQPLRRDQFLAGHWLLRLLAARRSGGRPQDWCLSTDACGRPVLTHADGPHLSWQASLSHSGDLLAAALDGQPVGIDVEAWPPRRPRDTRSLIESVCDETEQRDLAQCPTDRLDRAFLERWTLKEIGRAHV